MSIHLDYQNLKTSHSYKGSSHGILMRSGYHGHHHHHHHHLSPDHEGRWGTTDESTTSFLHFSLFSTALWDLANSRPVHSLMLSCHLFHCLPCHLPPFTVPCKMVSQDLMNRRHVQTTAVCVSLQVRRSSCGAIACWILAQTPSLVTWSLYEMHTILW